MEGIEKIEREVNVDEFKKSYEFEDKRKILVTLQYVNEDGTLEEITKGECEGAFVAQFNEWNAEHGAHNGCKKCVVKCSELDVATMILADDQLEGVSDMIASHHAKKSFGKMLKDMMAMADD